MGEKVCKRDEKKEEKKEQEKKSRKRKFLIDLETTVLHVYVKRAKENIY